MIGHSLYFLLGEWFVVNYSYHLKGQNTSYFYSTSSKPDSSDVIYIIRKDNSYDWIIGFNNYVESKRTINMLYSILKCKILDATENEYRDEDEYISSYIRFKR